MMDDDYFDDDSDHRAGLAVTGGDRLHPVGLAAIESGKSRRISTLKPYVKVKKTVFLFWR